MGSYLALLLYAALFASNVPYWDDFSLIEIMGEGTWETTKWLFTSHSGHRLPLGKAAQVVLFHFSGADFRAFPFVSMSLLGGASAVLLRGLWKRRGTVEYPDMAIPLILLSWGLAGALLRATLLSAGIWALLYSWLVVLVFRGEGPLSVRERLVSAGLCLLMSMTGMDGATTALPMAILLCWIEWKAHRRGDKGAVLVRIACWAILGAFAVMNGHAVLTAAKDSELLTPAPIGRVLAVSLQCMGLCFGPAGAFGWTQTGYGSATIPVLSLASVAMFVILEWSVFRAAAGGTHVGRRERLVALGCLLAGFPVHALAVGFARAGLGRTFGLQEHYAVFMVFMLATGYLVANLTMRKGTRDAFCFAVLLSATCLWSFNVQVGYRGGKARVTRMREFEDAVARGTPNRELASEFSPFLYFFREDLLRFLEKMERERLHPYEAR